MNKNYRIRKREKKLTPIRRVACCMHTCTGNAHANMHKHVRSVGNNMRVETRDFGPKSITRPNYN